MARRPYVDPDPMHKCLTSRLTVRFDPSQPPDSGCLLAPHGVHIDAAARPSPPLALPQGPRRRRPLRRNRRFLFLADALLLRRSRRASPPPSRARTPGLTEGAAACPRTALHTSGHAPSLHFVGFNRRSASKCKKCSRRVPNTEKGPRRSATGQNWRRGAAPRRATRRCCCCGGLTACRRPRARA